MQRTTGLIVLIFVFFIAGSAFVKTYDLPKSIERGKEVYTTYCQNCHMPNGNGMEGAFPTLVKSNYLQKPVSELIGVVMNGQSGEIIVNGITFNGIMPAQNYLTDEQIADVLNYVKNSWGNKSLVAITPEQAKKTRQ